MRSKNRSQHNQQPGFRTPERLRLDAVAASWTIGSEEDGPGCTWPEPDEQTLISVPLRRAARRAPGRASQGRALALTPGQRRR